MWMNLRAVEESLQTRSLGRRLVYLSSTSSTQDVARREAESGSPAGVAVVAEEQTAGRGRFQREWVSPAGQNLYLTLMLRPSADRLRTLSIIAPLAVALAVEEAGGIETQIKWPNDVRAGGRKLAGVLIESELLGQEVRYALVGMGVNVNFDVTSAPQIAEIATSVMAVAGRKVPREAMLAALLNRFEELYDGPPDSAFREWKSRLETLGRKVAVTFRGQSQDGVAEDVDHEGNLLLRTADGTLTTIEAAEVTLRA